MKAKISEKCIEETCSAFLELDGWRTLKTDPVRNKEWGKGFGELGMCDRQYIRYLYDRRAPNDLHCSCGMKEGCACTQVLWVEFKAPRGKHQANQRAWQAAERARGALVWVAKDDFPATIEGFMEFYELSGLMRKRIDWRTS